MPHNVLGATGSRLPRIVGTEALIQPPPRSRRSRELGRTISAGRLLECCARCGPLWLPLPRPASEILGRSLRRSSRYRRRLGETERLPVRPVWRSRVVGVYAFLARDAHPNWFVFTSTLVNPAATRRPGKPSGSTGL